MFDYARVNILQVIALTKCGGLTDRRRIIQVLPFSLHEVNWEQHPAGTVWLLNQSWTNIICSGPNQSWTNPERIPRARHAGAKMERTLNQSYWLVRPLFSYGSYWFVRPPFGYGSYTYILIRSHFGSAEPILNQICLQGNACILHLCWFHITSLSLYRSMWWGIWLFFWYCMSIMH